MKKVIAAMFVMAALVATAGASGAPGTSDPIRQGGCSAASDCPKGSRCCPATSCNGHKSYCGTACDACPY